MMLII